MAGRKSIGEFRIAHKSMNWGGGFGSRWLGLNPGASTGSMVLINPGHRHHGRRQCIRMFNRHVEQVFRIIPEGTIVRMVGRSPGRLLGSWSKVAVVKMWLLYSLP